MTRLSSPDVSASLSGDTVQRARKVPLWSAVEPAQAETLPRRDDLINRIISASIFSSCVTMSRESKKTSDLYLSQESAVPPCGVQPLNTEVCLCPEDAAAADIMSFVCFAVNSTDATVGEGLLFATRRRMFCCCCCFYRFIQIRWLNSITLHNHNPDR